MTNGSKTFSMYVKACDMSEHQQYEFTPLFLRRDFISDQLSDKEGQFANVSQDAGLLHYNHIPGNGINFITNLKLTRMRKKKNSNVRQRLLWYAEHAYTRIEMLI